MKLRQIGRRRKFHRVFTVESVLKTACLFFCIVGILTVTLIRSEGSGALRDRKRILITAHRGASHGAPENTRAAVELAIAEQADYVEIDVRMTADGVPVLMHDHTLFRTTGVVEEIDNVTYTELSTYDVGSRYAEPYRGETVPSLRDILETYGRKIRFNIELKGDGDRSLAEAVVKLVKAYGLEKRCVITSDSYELLEWVKKGETKLRTGYILSLVYGEVFGYDAVDFFSVKSDSVTEQMVRSAHAEGKEVHVWTVNKAYEIKRVQALGVDNIITDKPAYVREIIQSGSLAEKTEQ